MYQHIRIPSDGERIQVNDDNSLSVPDNPIIPFIQGCLLYTSPSPRDRTRSRMPSSA